jgi:hypothetical protein
MYILDGAPGVLLPAQAGLFQKTAAIGNEEPQICRPVFGD